MRFSKPVVHQICGFNSALSGPRSFWQRVLGFRVIEFKGLGIRV